MWTITNWAINERVGQLEEWRQDNARLLRLAREAGLDRETRHYEAEARRLREELDATAAKLW